MAEEEEKSSGGGGTPDPIFFIIALFFITSVGMGILWRLQVYIAQKAQVNDFLHAAWLFLHGEATLSDVIATSNSPTLTFLFLVFRVLSLVLSVLFAWYTVVTLRKLTELNKALRAPLQKPTGYVEPAEKAPEHFVNPKWAKVLTHFNSENPSDWKLAILEADIMLNDMLDKMGYKGATMSEKMKTIEQSDFSTLDYAWQAHKVRNSIAHEGSDFIISKHETQRILGLYKMVFDEFKYI